MERATVNLSEAVTFDLSVGRVNLRKAYPQILVPVQGLNALCEAAGEQATVAFGQQLGKQMGERIAQGLAERQAKVEKLTPEDFVAELRAQFALSGLGVVGLEKWGKALLVVLDHGQVSPSLASTALEAAISEATGRGVRAVHLMHDEARDRFLLASSETADRVRKWRDENVSWGEILVRLHTNAG